MPTTPQRRCSRRRPAFTLVELLIVVSILGILAAIVIPQFSNASQTARQNTLKDALRYMRTQIVVYKAQHLDVSPGYPPGQPGQTPDQTDFLNQMELYTDANGDSNAAYSNVYQYGSYLTQMPNNPVNGLGTLTVVPDNTPIPAADGTTGYIYQPQTTTIIPNIMGNDSDGVPYSTY